MGDRVKVLVELVHGVYTRHAHQEVIALARCAGDPDATIETIPTKPGQLVDVFAYASLLNEQVAQQICDRAMLVRGFYETFASADDYEGLLKHLEDPAVLRQMAPYFNTERTYKFAVGL